MNERTDASACLKAANAPYADQDCSAHGACMHAVQRQISQCLVLQVACMQLDSANVFRPSIRMADTKQVPSLPYGLVQTSSHVMAGRSATESYAASCVYGLFILCHLFSESFSVNKRGMCCMHAALYQKALPERVARPSAHGKHAVCVSFVL